MKLTKSKWAIVAAGAVLVAALAAFRADLWVAGVWHDWRTPASTRPAGSAATGDPRSAGSPTDDDSPAATIPAAQRPSHWARPREVKGVGNFHELSPTLFRGAQPTREGFEQLAKMGVKTVINLRKFHSDKELLEGTGLREIRVDTTAVTVDDGEVVDFLAAATDPANAPVFFHCQHGSDRTGTMAAMYRTVVQGWDKDSAIRELRQGGYGFHEAAFHNLTEYIRRADVASLRQKLVATAPR